MDLFWQGRLETTSMASGLHYNGRHNTPAVRMATKTYTPPEVQKTPTADLAPMYNVVLLDDDEHTYDYVIEMLQKIFLCSQETAYNHAREVDSTGRTVVITCGLLEAEFGRDQIHAYGPDWRMPKSKGPMRAIIEPAMGSSRLEG